MYGKRQKGNRETFHGRLVKTARGWVAAAFSSKGLKALCLPRETAKKARDRVRRNIAPHTLVFDGEAPDLNAIERYFKGETKSLPLKTDLEGATKFDLLVWKAARAIPYGETRSYGWVANRIGRPGAARAVGGALGRNPVPLVIPCHRVIRVSGELGGFGAGLEWKRRLLALETRFR